MDEQQKVRGPASYFPSIEKTYGQPIAHWLALLAGREERKHMALVAWLKGPGQAQIKAAGYALPH